MRSILFTHRLLDAIEMAVRVHGQMKRKGDGVPYITHPIAVFGLLVRWDADEDTLIAGLLHDTLEDARTDEQRAEYREAIRIRFGEPVLELVEGVTEQDKSLSWEERKEQYLEHLRNAPKESLLVSCADKTHNTFCLLQGYQDEGERFWDRFNGPKERKLWFYEEVLRICEHQLSEEITQQLAGLLRELHATA